MCGLVIVPLYKLCVLRVGSDGPFPNNLRKRTVIKQYRPYHLVMPQGSRTFILNVCGIIRNEHFLVAVSVFGHCRLDALLGLLGQIPVFPVCIYVIYIITCQRSLGKVIPSRTLYSLAQLPSKLRTYFDKDSRKFLFLSYRKQKSSRCRSLGSGNFLPHCRSRSDNRHQNHIRKNLNLNKCLIESEFRCGIYGLSVEQRIINRPYNTQCFMNNVKVQK